MVRNMTLTVILLIGCVWCFALVSRVDSAPSAGNKPFKPAISVHHMMEGQGLIFTQLSQAVTKKDTPHRYEVIAAFSSVIAELANVNTFNSDQDDYRGWAAQLRDANLELAEEAEKKKDADD